MTTTSTETAQDALLRLQAQIHGLLDEIAATVDDYDYAEMAHWGHVGDLGRIARYLRYAAGRES